MPSSQARITSGLSGSPALVQWRRRGEVVGAEVGLDEQPVERRRRAERGDLGVADDPEDRVGVGLAERDLDHRRALVPLAEEPAPGGLRPAGVGDRPVAVAGPQVVPEARGRDVAEPVGGGLQDHLRVADRAAGEEQEHRVVARGRRRRAVSPSPAASSSASKSSQPSRRPPSPRRSAGAAIGSSCSVASNSRRAAGVGDRDRRRPAAPIR